MPSALGPAARASHVGRQRPVGDRARRSTRGRPAAASNAGDARRRASGLPRVEDAHALDVALRPLRAGLAPRRDPLAAPLVVDGLHVAVDPAEAQDLVDACSGQVMLGMPLSFLASRTQSCGLGRVVGLQPRAELLGRGERRRAQAQPSGSVRGTISRPERPVLTTPPRRSWLGCRPGPSRRRPAPSRARSRRGHAEVRGADVLQLLRIDAAAQRPASRLRSPRVPRVGAQPAAAARRTDSCRCTSRGMRPRRRASARRRRPARR